MDIAIDRQDFLKVMCDLEFLVVSLGRIGSAELSEEEMGKLSNRFLVEGDVSGGLLSCVVC